MASTVPEVKVLPVLGDLQLVHFQGIYAHEMSSVFSIAMLAEANGYHSRAEMISRLINRKLENTLIINSSLYFNHCVFVRNAEYSLVPASQM